MRKAVALSIFLVVIGSATAFTASIKAEDRKASLEDPAHFTVEAENELSSSDRFTITRLNSPPATSGWFTYPYSKTVDGGENTTFDIKVFPSKYSVQQNYRFEISVSSSKAGESHELEDYFSVDTGTKLDIFSAEVMEQSYDPGETIRASIVVINTASTPISDYTVSADSLDEVKTSEGELIPSGSKKEFNFLFRLPEDAEPGTRDLDFKVVGDSENTQTKSFEVERVSRIVRNSSLEKKVVSSTEIASAMNLGNAAEDVSLNLSVESYLSPLTSFSEPADRVEESGGMKKYYWKRSLNPGEGIQVERKTEYWPPVVALVLLVSVLAGLERLYVGISADKTAKNVEEGIKIRLEIINRSRHKVEEVEVEDFVPDIASVDKEFPMAAPKVAKTGEGTRLTWDIGSLEPGEQRVMEYIVNPSVKVEGGVTFPSAEIIVEDEKLTETPELTAEFDPSNHG